MSSCKRQKTADGYHSGEEAEADMAEWDTVLYTCGGCRNVWDGMSQCPCGGEPESEEEAEAASEEKQTDEDVLESAASEEKQTPEDVSESDGALRIPFPRQLLQVDRRSKTARKERCARATFSGGRP